MKHVALISILVSTFMLGCASVSPEPGDAGTAIEKPAKRGWEQKPAMQAEQVEVPERPVRAFPIDTFYSLLVAEMAGSRGRYDIELGNYIQEAHRTRDPGVTARATRIARYLNAHQATLSTALLWVELEPDNAEARYIAATELAHDGQLTEAFKHSEELLNMGSSPLFQSIAAYAAHATDTQREALMADFERLLDTKGPLPELLVGKALLLQQDGKLNDALNNVRKALASEEDDITAVILEAQLLYQMERPEEALSRLMALLQQNPDDRRLRLQYARMLASVDLEEALEQFEILVDQSPRDPELLLSRALVANELGKIPLAESSFLQLLEMGEHTDTAHYYLGNIAAATGNLNSALHHYRQVRQGQDFLPALNRYLDILIRREELSQAQLAVDDMRRKYPSQAEQFYLLHAQVLSRHRHLEAAERILSEGLRQNPTSVDLLYSRALVNEQRDRIDLTEQDLRNILKYHPNNAAALNALGYTLADRTDRYEEAYELISRALSIEPNDPAIMDSMGWVQYRLGNYEEALLRLREAMKAFPDPEIAAHLGEVLWVMGDTEQARATWTKGMELNPNNDIIPRVIKRLEANL